MTSIHTHALSPEHNLDRSFLSELERHEFDRVSVEPPLVIRTVNTIEELKAGLTFEMTNIEVQSNGGIYPRLVGSNTTTETISGSFQILTSALNEVRPGVGGFVLDTQVGGVFANTQIDVTTVTFNLPPGGSGFVDLLWANSAWPDGVYTFYSEPISATASESGAFTDDPLTWTVVAGTPDLTAPSGYSVSIDQAILNASSSQNASFTFTGAEESAAYNYSFASSGGAGSVTGSGTILTAIDQIAGIDLSELPDGILTLEVFLTDESGNVGETETATVTKDASVPEAPSVTSIGSDTGASATDGVTNDNTVIINGEAEPGSSVEVLSGNNTLGVTTATLAGAWTLDYSDTPLSDGAYSITARATDEAGNLSPTSAPFELNVDTSVPTVALTSSIGDLINGTFEVTVTFDEPVVNFSLSDIAIENGVGSDFTEVTPNTVWTSIVTPAADGMVSVQVNAGMANDVAGNSNIISNEISSIFDGTGPEVSSVVRADADQLNNADSEAAFTVTFSEDVTGVDLADFELVLTGTATGNLNNLEAVDGTTYTIIVNDISGQGTVGLNVVNDNTILDAASNSLAAAFIGDVYTINWIPTSIELSSQSIQENNVAEAEIGVLSTIDQNTGDSHTYSLVAGEGDAGNASFTISGNSLRAVEIFDFESAESYSIRVQTDDGFGGMLEQVIQITIENELEPSFTVSGVQDFGEVVVGSSATNSWQVTNTGEVPLEVVLSSSNNIFGFSSSSIEVSVGVSEEVAVTFTPEGEGSTNADLEFTFGEFSEVFQVAGTGLIATSIEESISSIQFEVYPNPVSDFLSVDFNGFNIEEANAYFLDASGRIAKTFLNIRGESFVLNTSDMKPGIYYLRITSNDLKATRKIVIK